MRDVCGGVIETTEGDRVQFLDAAIYQKVLPAVCLPVEGFTPAYKH
jgi:hypothetical protein